MKIAIFPVVDHCISSPDRTCHRPDQLELAPLVVLVHRRTAYGRAEAALRTTVSCGLALNGGAVA